MIKINDETRLVGSTELRTEIPKLIKDAKIRTVIVMKRGKPVAVFESYQEYQEKTELLETFEDIVLGYMAKERHEKSQKDDYVPGEKILKKLKIKI